MSQTVTFVTALLLSVGTFGGMNSLVSFAQEPSKPESAEFSLETDFKWLFDKKTLEGWEGNAEWFRIMDDCIVAGSLEKAIPHNEFLCTQADYENFELRLQVRLKGKGDNAGVQFRSVRIPGKTEVSGFQCDVGSAFGRPVWGALYDESRRNKMLAEGDKEKVPEWLRKDDWNDLAVRAQGGRIQIWLNGNLTVDYTEADEKIAKSGVIALQIHSGPPTEAWYRNIRIMKLSLPQPPK